MISLLLWLVPALIIQEFTEEVVPAVRLDEQSGSPLRVKATSSEDIHEATVSATGEFKVESPKAESADEPATASETALLEHSKKVAGSAWPPPDLDKNNVQKILFDIAYTAMKQQGGDDAEAVGEDGFMTFERCKKYRELVSDGETTLDEDTLKMLYPTYITDADIAHPEDYLTIADDPDVTISQKNMKVSNDPDDSSSEEDPCSYGKHPCIAIELPVEDVKAMAKEEKYEEKYDRFYCGGYSAVPAKGDNKKLYGAERGQMQGEDIVVQSMLCTTPGPNCKVKKWGPKKKGANGLSPGKYVIKHIGNAETDVAYSAVVGEADGEYLNEANALLKYVAKWEETCDGPRACSSIPALVKFYP